MDSEFWIKVWDEGKTNFHQVCYNDKLLEHFPQLFPHQNQRVLVPLCGKSLDLIWLHDLKLKVHGVELYDQVVKSFFEESKLSPVKMTQDQDFKHYFHKDIVISSGDFFKLNEKESYDFIYDRASLVALPVSMRKSYSEIIKNCLKIGGKYLLIVYEYDQSKVDGPPFSVDEDEIYALYNDQFKIKLVESKQVKVGPKFAVLENCLKQNVYVLEKTTL